MTVCEGGEDIVSDVHRLAGRHLHSGLTDAVALHRRLHVLEPGRARSQRSWSPLTSIR